MERRNFLLGAAATLTASAAVTGPAEAAAPPLERQPASLGVTDLAKRVTAMEGQFTHLVIDTRPQHDDILRAGLMVTDTFVIPCQPTPMDTAQLDSTGTL
ncbi:hypothetical protein ABZ917_21880 [Nonomuraea wenchangensis]